jgi:hypothetical protein
MALRLPLWHHDTFSMEPRTTLLSARQAGLPPSDAIPSEPALEPPTPGQNCNAVRGCVRPLV